MDTFTMNSTNYQLHNRESSGVFKQRASLVAKSKVLWLVGMLAVSLFANAQVDIETGLQHFYAFEGNLNDSTTNNFNGTVTAGALELAQGFDGASNSAYYFDGTDKVSFGNIPLGSGSFTLALWMKVPALVSNYSHSLFSKRSVCGEGQFFDIRITNSSTLGYTFGIEMRDDGQTGHVNTNFGTFDQWVHVAFVKNSDTHTSSLFINGDSITSAVWTSTTLDMTNTANFSIGSTPCLSNPNTGPFKGTLDEVRFYNRACTETEILKMTVTNLPVFDLSTQKLYLQRNFATKTITVSNQLQSGVTYSLTSTPETPSFITNSFNTTNGTLILNPVLDASGDVVYTITASANGETYSKEVEISVVPEVDIETGLKHYYAFEGNLNDSTSNNYNGTVTAGALELALGFDGVSNSAYYFDGTDKVSFGNIPLGSGSFTLAFWMKVPELVSNYSHSLFSKRPICGEGQFFDIRVTNSSTLGYSIGVEMRDDGQTGGVNTNFGTTDQWVHIAYVKNNSTQTSSLFINGDSVTSTTWTNSTMDMTNTANFAIGSTPCSVNPNIGPFIGTLDEVRFYDRACKEPEIFNMKVTSLPMFDLSTQKLSLQRNFATKTITVSNQILSGVTYSLTSEPESPSFINHSFNTTDGTLILNPVVDASGKVVYTITASANGETYSKEVEITIAPEVDIETGLQHFYAFEGNLNDSTTNNFNGTVTAGTLGLVPGFDGALNSAYYFDGTDKVSFGNIPLGSGSFTLAFWMKVPALVSNYSHSFFSKRPVCTDGQFFDIRVTNSSTLGYTIGVEMRDDGQTGHVSTQYGNIDQWVHIAFVKNSDTHTSSLFINGDSIASSNWSSTTIDMTNTANFAIGSTPCSVNPNIGPFKGTLDEVRFYNRACREAEILKMTGTDLPVFAVSTQELFLESNFVTQTITVFDQIQTGVTYSLTSVPENPSFITNSFNTTNGTLILNPVVDSSGYVVYTITASANGETYSKEVEITVGNNAPEVINPISDYQVYEDNGVFQVNPDVISVFTDPDGDTLSYSVVSSDPTNVSVAINNNSIFVTVAPDHFGIANITLTASDGLASVTDVFQVEILSVNDAPIFMLSQNSLTLEQDFTGTETINVIPETVPANESNQVVNYTITPATYANVGINSSTGLVSITSIAGLYGTQEITVVASDGQTQNYLYYLTFSLTINKVNAAPTDIQLSSQQVAENNEGTTWIGELSSTDVDEISGFSYALVAGEGDTDNSLFFFLGGGASKSNLNTLYSNVVFNFEEKASYSIRIRTSDSWGATYEKSFSIGVVDQNDAPTSISINEFSLTENSSLGTIVGSFVVSDEDASDTHNIWLYNGEAEVANDNSNFVIDGMHLKVNGPIDFEVKPTYTILVYAADAQGFTTNVITFNLSVTDVIETSISVNDENKELHLYPNPSDGKFTLQTGDSNDETIIRIIHISGKEVYVGQFGKDELEIGVDISNQPAGTYIVSIIKGNRVIHKSMVLE